jgi:hypothetical protein
MAVISANSISVLPGSNTASTTGGGWSTEQLSGVLNELGCQLGQQSSTFATSALSTVSTNVAQLSPLDSARASFFYALQQWKNNRRDPDLRQEMLNREAEVIRLEKSMLPPA